MCDTCKSIGFVGLGPIDPYFESRDYIPCPNCLGKLICPKCGKDTLFQGDPENPDQPTPGDTDCGCASCGWGWEENLTVDGEFERLIAEPLKNAKPEDAVYIPGGKPCWSS